MSEQLKASDELLIFNSKHRIGIEEFASDAKYADSIAAKSADRFLQKHPSEELRNLIPNKPRVWTKFFSSISLKDEKEFSETFKQYAAAIRQVVRDAPRLTASGQFYDNGWKLPISYFENAEKDFKKNLISAETGQWTIDFPDRFHLWVYTRVLNVAHERAKRAGNLVGFWGIERLGDFFMDLNALLMTGEPGKKADQNFIKYGLPSELVPDENHVGDRNPKLKGRFSRQPDPGRPAQEVNK